MSTSQQDVFEEDMKESADEVLERALPLPSDKQAPGSEAPASATVHAWNKDNFGVLFTLRDTDGRSLFTRMGNFCKVLKAEGWKPDWKNDAPSGQPAATSQPVTPQPPPASLGVCKDCGAPNAWSKNNKRYCGAKCWLK